MNIRKYLLFGLLMFLLPIAPRYDRDRVYDVYRIIQKDALMFKDHDIIKRGDGFYVWKKDEYQLIFARDRSNEFYNYKLRNREYWIQRSRDYYEMFGFTDERSLMIHYSRMLSIFEELDLVLVTGIGYRYCMNSISFGVTYNDELYYFTVNSTIPADCYGYMLEQGEVSQLDSNWFYVKRNTPLYGAGD